MCTATWIYSHDSYELFFNRDELHTRAPAIPPHVQEVKGIRYVAPMDPDGGGTWIGTNEYGLTAALLNFYPGVDSTQRSPFIGPREGMISRGEIVCSAMAYRTVDGVASMLESNELARYNPFTLLCISSEGGPVRMQWFDEFLVDKSPKMPLSSSSFRTGPVIANRISTFAKMQTQVRKQMTTQSQKRMRTDEQAAAHTHYHRSHTPEKGAFSVCMHREDAQTQSYTHVVVDADRINYTYLPGSPCTTEALPEVSINR